MTISTTATEARLAALERYGILDTPPEQAFDEIVQLAAEICDAPIAVINLIETNRQWFKAVVGLDVRETPIGISICAHMLGESGVVVVPDTRADARLATNPLITGQPGLHFYAGAILAADDGAAFGTLCVLDHHPRAEGLTPRQHTTLARLGRQVIAQMELRMVGRALREREARLHAMAELLPQLMWGAGPDGVPDYYNARWFEYTNMTPDVHSGHSWLDFVHPDDRAKTIRQWNRAVLAEGSYEIEYRLRSGDGSFRWFLGRAVAVRDAESGKPTRWLGTATDIEDVVRARNIERDINVHLEREVNVRTRELADANTMLRLEAEQRGRAEEALRQAQKMEALGQLTAGIAHDFNNLLTGILGSLELVRQRVATGRIQDLDRFILAASMAANRATGLTGRLLTFARRQALAPNPTDVNALLTAMEEFIRRTVGDGISLTMILSNTLWVALCDADQLENALLNLVINARDAMAAGEGQLCITTSNTVLDEAYCATQAGASPGDYVCIEVLDTGTGMSPEVAARVMEPFFTTKAVGQGTGLGMSMLYGFIEQSGGHVRLKTAPGAGTSVALHLPRSTEPVMQTVLADAHRGGETAGRTYLGRHAFIVEDDATVRLLLREQLADAGFAVTEAADGLVGLRMIETQARIDLLVTDIGLPGLDGLMLAKRAQALRPSLRTIVVTAYGDHVLEGDLSDRTRVLRKPFALAELDAAIALLLKPVQPEPCAG